MKTLLATTSILIAVLLLFTSCNILGGGESDPDGLGVIVPGKSFDGVELGDLPEHVEELLGEPSGAGWSHGFWRSHKFYHYTPPGVEGLGLHIMFIEKEDGSLGPVDALSAHPPYEGKTPQGIAIGSTLSEVKQTYGEPDFTSETILKNGSVNRLYTYCMNNKKFNIGTRDNVVTGFFMGYFVPLKEDPKFSHCNNNI